MRSRLSVFINLQCLLLQCQLCNTLPSAVQFSASLFVSTLTLSCLQETFVTCSTSWIKSSILHAEKPLLMAWNTSQRSLGKWQQVSFAELILDWQSCSDERGICYAVTSLCLIYDALGWLVCLPRGGCKKVGRGSSSHFQHVSSPTYH